MFNYTCNITDDLIPAKSNILLYGPKCAKKSIISLDIAFSLSSESGRYRMQDVSKPCDVLYVYSDFPELVSERLKEWSETFGARPDCISYLQYDYLFSPLSDQYQENYTFLYKYVKDYKPQSENGLRLVVIDVNGTVLNAHKRVCKATTAYIEFCNNIVNRFSCSVISTCMNKYAKKFGFDTVFEVATRVNGRNLTRFSGRNIQNELQLL